MGQSIEVDPHRTVGVKGAGIGEVVRDLDKQIPQTISIFGFPSEGLLKFRPFLLILLNELSFAHRFFVRADKLPKVLRKSLNFPLQAALYMQTIDLKTTQNVTIEYELATLGERMLAVIVDLIVVGIAYFLLAAIVTAAFNATWSGMQAGIFGFVLPLACFLVYNFLFELLSHGQSLGKRALSIQVVRLDGEEPAPADYLLRALFYFVDLMATAGILGGLLISSSPKRQRLGDMTAGTSVIKMNASNRFGLGDILRISSLEDYEPRYPQVRQFSEEDMLLIKNTIARYQRYPNSANRNILQDLAAQLGLQLDAPREETRNAAEFLKTLIRDYIVLTR